MSGGRSAGWARLALLALVGGVLLPLLAAGLKSLLAVLVGIAGLALTAVGVWWALAYRGVARVAGALLSVSVPLGILALYAFYGLLWPAFASLALWGLAVAAARTALTAAGAASSHRHAKRDKREKRDKGGVEAPRRPWIVMNPRSGGGKVARFQLVEKARAAGAQVTLLDPELHQDVAELARQAVADGADLLAVAGGDGTQALVAEVAARHDLPFAVIPAGTRNHFALDLGLDREDPAAALEALTDGEEFQIDLGFAADRVFVNNASFGTYAVVVGDPAYRDRKVRTVLQNLPDLLTGEEAPRLAMRAGQTSAEGLQALLVSNNPYRRFGDPSAPGRREGLDSGLLGVLCVRVESGAEAAGLVTDPRSPGLLRLTAAEVVVQADGDTVPVGIDGEHVVLDAPVVCRIAPGVLRVRVPRHRPGTPATRPALDWPRVARLALGRLVPPHSAPSAHLPGPPG
ncbi:diacylglycerol/lipid kinase family protein [Streptomyces sp. NPDC054794]